MSSSLTGAVPFSVGQSRLIVGHIFVAVQFISSAATLNSASASSIYHPGSPSWVTSTEAQSCIPTDTTIEANTWRLNGVQLECDVGIHTVVRKKNDLSNPHLSKASTRGLPIKDDA